MAKRFFFLFLGIAYLAWLASWFWVFSFGFSSSFFEFHRDTRIPVFLLALLAIAVPPLSCFWTLRRVFKKTLSPLWASLLNLAISAAPLGIFWGVLAAWIALARRAGHSAFEADEAMGNGIVYLFCVAVFGVAAVFVPLVLGGRALWQRRRS